jgi:hypothetical protein
MRKTSRSAAAAACFLIASVSQASDPELRDLAVRAASADPEEAQSARTRLRAAGPRGLDVLLAVHAAALAQPRSRGDLPERAHAAADAVAGQRHAAAARLFWYTDLHEARARARETGRPILSLRLLGRLDEEFSCANSRFFRTVLYANHEVADALRSRFVLHWSSERPAPRVTVDFGDGRRLEGTLTGNSIHYILDAEGRPVDALPGLYGPRVFLEGLTRAEAAVRGAATREGAAREAWLRDYHRERLAELAQRFQQDARGANLADVPALPALVAAAPPMKLAMRAAAADRLAMTKSIAERPLLRSVMGPTAVPPVTANEPWSSLAALYVERLDAGSLERLRADGVDPAGEAVLALRGSMAEDTVRNEYLLHYRLHQWLAEEAQGGRELETLNARVYSELFLTPRTDPWLGLVAPGVYSGLRVPAPVAR